MGAAKGGFELDGIVTEEFIQFPQKPDSFGSECLTAKYALDKLETTLNNWYAKKQSRAIDYPKPDKVVCYCDNMMPAIMFRHLKHGAVCPFQSNRFFNNILNPLHQQMEKLYIQYFKQHCKHMTTF